MSAAQTGTATHGEEPQETESQGIRINRLSYSFPGGQEVLKDFTMNLPMGSRTLLLGCNGAGANLAYRFSLPWIGNYRPEHDNAYAGKTTLLMLIAGRFMVDPEMKLASTGELAYLGHQWRRSVACAGGDLPMQGDIAARKLIFNVPDVDPARRQRLIDLLDIDLDWHMHCVSDGQRRRVQICMGLLKPFKVLLMDEVTVDMDVLGRLQLLRFFEEECKERGCVILYATHIYDGISNWMTHVAFVSDGEMVRGGPVEDFPQLQQGKVLHTASKWLRDEREKIRARPKPAARSIPKKDVFGSRQMAFFR